MQKRLMLNILLLVLFSFPLAAEAKLKVVATLPTLGALARELGGDLVSVTTLATNGEDPHFVSPRPDYVLKLSRADLLIYNGMELEIGWLPPVQKNARNRRTMEGGPGLLDASKVVTPLAVPRGQLSRAQGDVHGEGNPHYLYSLPEVRLVARAISEKLRALDPDHSAQYADLLSTFEQKAAAKEAFWQSKFQALSAADKRLVSYHDSFIYLTHWLDLKQVATVEPLPGVAPGPAHVKKLVAELKAAPVKYIIQENYQPRPVSQKIAAIVGAKVVIIDPGPGAGESYLAYLDRTLKEFF